MHGVIATSLVALSLALIAGSAVAQQPAPTTPPAAQTQPTWTAQDCPKYIADVSKELNIRFDPAAANARQMIANAQQLQSAGKWGDCVATAQKALASLGVKM
jgi:hypothetical protein